MGIRNSTQRDKYNGKEFGRWTVIRHAGYRGSRKKTVLFCRCKCGVEKEVLAETLTANGIRQSRSCGCLFREIIRVVNKTHGKTASIEYKSWSQMIQRCTNPKNPGYINYGGRGITVHESWLTFDNFYKDMGDKPSTKHSIERVDNEKGYGPDNCVWATRMKQNQNTRATLRIMYKGKTQCLREWADELHINYGTLRSRFRYGWTVEEAFSTGV